MTKNIEKINEDFLEKFNSNFEKITEKYTYEPEKLENNEELKNVTNRLISKFAVYEEVDFDHALIGIAALFQCGAYLLSVSNRKITIGNKEFSKANLIHASQAIENKKYTYRSIARYLRTTIAKIADKYNIPGNLYARFKIENATLISKNDEYTNKKIAIYCTDFQLENPDTPEVVREFLANREKLRTKKP